MHEGYNTFDYGRAGMGSRYGGLKATGFCWP